MAGDNGASNNGITFLGALQVLFIGLKLTGYINWAWWQVLLPLIFQAITVLIAILLVLLGA